MFAFVDGQRISVVRLQVLGHELHLGECETGYTYRIFDAVILQVSHVREEHRLDDRVKSELKVLLVKPLLHLQAFRVTLAIIHFFV